MKRLLLPAMALILTMLVSVSNGFGQLLLEENFDYPVNDLITAHGWTAHSSAGTQPITVSSPGLVFTGYPSSAVGNAALLDNTGEDDNHVFTVQSTGNVYISFMVNVTATSAGYFLHLGGDPIGSTFRGKVFMDATNHFGASVGNNTGNYATNTYSLGTTYLLVLKYEIVTGTSNDIVSLFIFDSSIPGSEPPVPAVGPLTDATMSDINPGSVALRQFNATQNLTVDGIRIGTSWADILPSGVTAPTVQSHDISFSNITATSMSASWISGNGSKRIVKINTANSFTNPADGTDPTANTVYGGTGEQVIYNGNGNSVPVTGLNGNTTYWFRVYEYNGTGSFTKYLTTTATLNPNSQITPVLLTPPVISSPTVANITASSATLGGNITYNGGVNITERGTSWKLTPGVTISDNKLAEGGTATGVFSHLRTGLPPQTQVYAKAYATNSLGTTLTNEISFYTLSAEPTSHVTGFTATAAGNTSINLAWTLAANGATGYLVIQKASATPPTGTPSDGVAYSEGATIGDGVVAAIVTPASTLVKSIVGLSPGTQYYFTIFPYSFDGTHPETYNYFTTPVVPSATATTSGTAPVVYTWIGADNGTWTTAANWSPARSTPGPSDILQFNDGTTKTITGVISQSIARLVISNNTTINLQSAAATTLSITGASGPDLSVPTGCNLNFNAVNAITMNIATTATASISGGIKFSATATTAHRLTATDPGAIVFNSGAIFTAGAFFSGNPFGISSLNSVIFAGGSTYLQQAGSNPFGAGQPNSVVVFQHGSLFKVTANLTPQFSGRNYADFEMDATGITLSPTGTTAVSIDNLTITNGTLNFNLTGPTTGMHQIQGNITVQAGAVLNFAPASASTISFSGGIQQILTTPGTLTMNANTTFEIANGSDLTLNSPLNLTGNLKLTSGLLSLGNNNCTMSASSVITGTPSASAMIVPTGTGQFIKTFNAGFTGTVTFPVGDSTGIPEYSPVTLNFTSGTFAAGSKIGVNLVNAKYPSDPNTVNYLNRYWTVTPTGITGYSCDAAFQYVPADVNGNEQQMFSMQVVPTPFTDFSIVNFGLHQVIANGLSNLGTYTGSQPKPRVVTQPADLIGANSATLHGEVIACYLPTSVSFEYGLTTSYGSVIQATPNSVNGGGTNTVLANLTGLTVGTTYHFRISGTNLQGTSYGNDLTFTTLCPSPATGGTITGPAQVCVNGTGYIYSVPVIANATSYTWTVPSGASITAGNNTNSITVSFGATALSGNITVFGTSVCGSGIPSPGFSVTVNPLPVPVISGPNSVCINSSGHVYTTQTGMTGYNWSISGGGIITAGQGTASITTSWNSTGNQTVSVVYTNSIGCTAATPSVYNLNVTPLPVPAITGPNVVCANAAGIVYTTEAGMSNYNWGVSIGGTILSGQGTNAITVLWPYAGQRTVTVTYSSPIGCAAASPTVYNVTINPAAVPMIGSSNDPCVNSSGNQYITNSGMTGYTWNISPGGTIDNGLGTNVVNVTWNATGNQWVSVGFTNSFGCTTVNPTVYNLWVNSPPNAAGTITGTSEICAGTTGVSYSCPEITNATSYQWSLPQGAAIVSGTGTNHITVDFSSNASSGNITVSGVNMCGTGTPSPNFAITVHPVPPAPVITANGATLTSSASAGNQWFFAGSPIPGATGQQYTATQTGYYWCVVTLYGCTSPISNKIYVVAIGTGENPAIGFDIFPNPSQGEFTVRFNSNINENAEIQIFNPLGIQVCHQTIYQDKEELIESLIRIGNPVNGIYLMKVTYNNQTFTRKVVIHN